MPDYFDTGFCVRERSWHGKEVLLDKAPESWDEARLVSGLMWEPRLVPLFYGIWERDDDDLLVPLADGSHPEGRDAEYRDGAWFVRRFAQHTEGQRVERDDNGGTLGTVSGTFQLITHAEMGQLLEPVLSQPGCSLDTMGSVKEGRSVYATVLLDEPYQVQGDVDGFGDPVLTLPYFAIVNSHDGTGACKGLYTQVRVVCANTVQAASVDGDRHGAQFSLRHTSGVKARLDEAKDIITHCREEADRWRTIGAALAATPITEAQQIEFLDRWMPVPEANAKVKLSDGTIGSISERQRNNLMADRTSFLHVLRDSATNSGMQDNALGLFNAAVEWADHMRRFQSQESLLARQILRTEPVKTQALRFVREVAGVGVGS